MKLEVTLQWGSHVGGYIASDKEIDMVKKVRKTLSDVWFWMDQENRLAAEKLKSAIFVRIADLDNGIQAFRFATVALAKLCKDLGPDSVHKKAFETQRQEIAECIEYLTHLLYMMDSGQSHVDEEFRKYAVEHDRESIGLKD